jgi:hypothetical protein
LLTLSLENKGYYLSFFQPMVVDQAAVLGLQPLYFAHLDHLNVFWVGRFPMALGPALPMQKSAKNGEILPRYDYPHFMGVFHV